MSSSTPSARTRPEHVADRWGFRRELRDLLVAVTGGAIVGMPLLYTMIAGRLSPWQLGAVMLASLALCYIILYASGIKDHPVHIPSLVQSQPAETVITYAASLAVALALLGVLGEPEAVGSVNDLVAAAVVLGLPTCVGGAAGRIAL